MVDMDTKLKKLFEYQKFANNPRLDEVIKRVEPQNAVELDDESLFAVAGGKSEKPDDEQIIK